MQISSILAQQAVRVVAGTSSKKRLFQEIAEIAQSAYDLTANSTIEALLERESLGPTGVGHGVALPHARLSSLDDVKGVFISLETPLDFDALDRQPVDIIFALFAPLNTGADHLKALALVSRTLREQSVCTKLRANPNPNTLYTILTDDPAIKAA